ncbi:MAG: hypothetical protein F4Z08_07860 [Chloroflexi bacterium]|nr:hypothetical protein [Chloroflexota bacterium]
MAEGISWQIKVKAYRALPHLVEAARAGTTLTYKELGEKIELHHRPLRYALDFIRDDICRRHGLPLLNSIVVNGDTGEPGDGWLPDGVHADLSEEQARVRALADWDAKLKEFGFSASQ